MFFACCVIDAARPIYSKKRPTNVFWRESIDCPLAFQRSESREVRFLLRTIAGKTGNSYRSQRWRRLRRIEAA
ncbi:hypothetical protein Pcaca05_31650 [Pectobacterium carotovorum subsp. carotovorum]|nr:hypothetical protein Pcaca05_31650 [Pectobacterium carotovorum subsp. carotovorum]